LGLKFMYDAYYLLRTNNIALAYKLFRFSITYLLILFSALLVDHIWRVYA